MSDDVYYTLTPCKGCGYRTKTWMTENRECYRCGSHKTKEVEK